MKETLPYSRITPIAVLMAVLVFAVFLRTWHLSDESAWYDEVLSLQHLNAPTLHDYLDQTSVLNAPTQPLYFALLYAWCSAFVPSENTARAFSILISLGSILMVFLILRKTLGNTPGLIAATLMAVRTSSVALSQEIRMYPLVVFLCLLSLYTFLQVLETDRRDWWTVHLLVTVAMVWTHAFAAFALAAEGMLYLLYGPKGFRKQCRWFIPQFLACMTLAIWLQHVDLTSVSRQMAWLHPPSLQEVCMGILDLRPTDWNGAVEEKEEHFRWVLLLFHAMTVLALTGSIAAILRTRRNRTTGNPLANPQKAHAVQFTTIACLLWLIVPFVAFYVLSIAWKPCFVPRYACYAWPAACMIIASVQTLPKNKIASILYWALILMLVASQSFFVLAKPMRAPWHAVRRALESEPAGRFDIRMVTLSPEVSSKQRTVMKFHLKGMRYSESMYEDMDSLLLSLEKDQPQNKKVQVLFLAMNEKARQFELFLTQENRPYKKHYMDAAVPMTLFNLGK